LWGQDTWLYIPEQLNFFLLIEGGEYPDGSASRAMWRYDPVLNTWHEMAPMNVCRYFNNA
jgi:hypothetical protein